MSAPVSASSQDRGASGHGLPSRSQFRLRTLLIIQGLIAAILVVAYPKLLIGHRCWVRIEEIDARSDGIVWKGTVLQPGGSSFSRIEPNCRTDSIFGRRPFMWPFEWPRRTPLSGGCLIDPPIKVGLNQASFANACRVETGTYVLECECVVDDPDESP